MPSTAARNAPHLGLAPEHAAFISEPGKFQGERVAVRMAYDLDAEGFSQDAFGEADAGGYFARVLFDESPHIVCFVVNSDGFVTEITNSEFEAYWAQHVEETEGEAD
jgi:hypothetical protein